MMKKQSTFVALRPKRQLTLPREVCEALDIEPGARLELTLEGKTLKIKPAYTIALEALGEIREAFQTSGMTEKELLEAGKRARKTVYGEPGGRR